MLRSSDLLAEPPVDSDDGPRRLLRTVLGGPGATILQAFEALRQRDSVCERLDSLNLVTQRVTCTRGGGDWELLQIGSDIFVVMSRCSYSDPCSEMVPPDDQEMVEFHFSLEGPVQLTTDDGDCFCLREAELLICGGHTESGYTVACPSGPRIGISLYVNPAYLIEALNLGALSPSVQPLLKSAGHAVTLRRISMPADMLRVVSDLIAMPYHGQRRLFYAHAKVNELLCLCAQSLESQENACAFDTLTERDIRILRRARDILATRLSAPPTVCELATLVGTNATKLKAEFKRLFGTTIFEYRHHCRMTSAMRLLSQDKLPVSVVARMVGYERQSSFSLAFREYFGFLPKVARRLSREPNASAPVAV